MKLKWILTLCVMVFFCSGRPSYGMSFTPVGILGFGSATISPPVTGTSVGLLPMTYGAGVLFGFKISRKIFLELGFLYLPRGFQENDEDGSWTSLTFKTIQAPLILQYYVLDGIYIGGGGYFSHGFGNIASASSTGSGGDLTYAIANYGADDAGAIANIGMKLPLLPFMSIIVDGRYIYSLQNISKTSGITTYFRDFQVLGGVRFGI